MFTLCNIREIPSCVVYLRSAPSEVSNYILHSRVENINFFFLFTLHKYHLCLTQGKHLRQSYRKGAGAKPVKDIIFFSTYLTL